MPAAKFLTLLKSEKQISHHSWKSAPLISCIPCFAKEKKRKSCFQNSFSSALIWTYKASEIPLDSSDIYKVLFGEHSSLVREHGPLLEAACKGEKYKDICIHHAQYLGF